MKGSTHYCESGKIVRKLAVTIINSNFVKRFLDLKALFFCADQQYEVGAHQDVPAHKWWFMLLYVVCTFVQLFFRLTLLRSSQAWKYCGHSRNLSLILEAGVNISRPCPRLSVTQRPAFIVYLLRMTERPDSMDKSHSWHGVKEQAISILLSRESED